MIALLITRCGCQKVMAFSQRGGPDSVIRIPLKQRDPFIAYDYASTMPKPYFREFQTHGDFDEIGRMIYEEVIK